MKKLLAIFVLFTLLVFCKVANARFYPHAKGWERWEIRQHNEFIKKAESLAKRKE